ncbi:hypothetical protein D3C87_1069630 [compost metagenome]
MFAAVAATICFWLSLCIFFNWQIASIIGLAPATLLVLLVINAGENSEINYIEKIFNGHPWLLWSGHFIEHQRMPEDEYQAVNPNPQNVIQVGHFVHVARSKRDLMLLKLSLGDYL